MRGCSMRGAAGGVTLLTLLLTGPASAQQLDGSLNGLLFGSLNSGLSGNLPSSLSGTLGQAQEGRTRAQTQLEERGFGAAGSCAPGQLDLNHSGCRPVAEFRSGLAGTTLYDQSAQGLRPLISNTLDGLILTEGGGPAGPLE